jgi:hypothetical protein
MVIKALILENWRGTMEHKRNQELQNQQAATPGPRLDSHLPDPYCTPCSNNSSHRLSQSGKGTRPHNVNSSHATTISGLPILEIRVCRGNNQCRVYCRTELTGGASIVEIGGILPMSTQTTCPPHVTKPPYK